jgi:hypothetical protein
LDAKTSFDFSLKANGQSLYGHCTHYVTVRVVIERKWANWNPKIGIKGNWNYTYINNRGTASYDVTESYHLTFNTSSPSNLKWPSSFGTIKRKGNGTLSYTLPTGIPTMTSYQRGDN